MVLQGKATFCLDLYGEGALLPPDSSSRRKRGIFDQAQSMKRSFGQGSFQSARSVKQMALIGSPKARTTQQWRIAKRGQQQAMGWQGLSKPSLRPVTWDRWLDTINQLFQPCLLVQVLH